FLDALCARTGRQAQSTDVLALATPRPGQPDIDLTPLAGSADDAIHPRLARAHRYRDDVRAWQADGGIVMLGRGVGIDEDDRVRGEGDDACGAWRWLSGEYRHPAVRRRITALGGLAEDVRQRLTHPSSHPTRPRARRR
ncbi:MAG: hypothetical protein ACRDPO_33020, partial [Streptosporangiaceae bacterium]